jgi:hypothetical protein
VISSSARLAKLFFSREIGEAKALGLPFGLFAYAAIFP